jgi:hypothetical protein
MKANISKEARAILDDPVASAQLHGAIQTARTGQPAILEAGGRKYQVFTDPKQAEEAFERLERSRAKPR